VVSPVFQNQTSARLAITRPKRVNCNRTHAYAVRPRPGRWAVRVNRSHISSCSYRLVSLCRVRLAKVKPSGETFTKPWYGRSMSAMATSTSEIKKVSITTCTR
jgi:hypothetical protein